MNEYLIVLEYHYPKDYKIWNKGIMEDYEAHTGLFVRADSVEQALEWGSVVATSLLNYVHGMEGLTLEQFQHECSLEEVPNESGWSHCLSFFQHVACGEMPKLDQMTTEAYVKWQKNNTSRLFRWFHR